MFLFSMGVTRGKWGTLINTLCSFKHHYDANTPLAQVMPELVQDYPDTYANMGIHDLGDKMFAWLRENNPGAVSTPPIPPCRLRRLPRATPTTRS
ncbi:hypothetical protein L243_10000 [Salmonella enterica subsp. enterica serovar Worthington str. BCH-3008]|nr:hypothetical protein L243_10000 [Salmonella enterica subsp. enterica serovar Worthington str. BCH-3008]